MVIETLDYLVMRFGNDYTDTPVAGRDVMELHFHTSHDGLGVYGEGPHYVARSEITSLPRMGDAKVEDVMTIEEAHALATALGYIVSLANLRHAARTKRLDAAAPPVVAESTV